MCSGPFDQALLASGPVQTLAGTCWLVLIGVLGINFSQHLPSWAVLESDQEGRGRATDWVLGWGCFQVPDFGIADLSLLALNCL